MNNITVQNWRGRDGGGAIEEFILFYFPLPTFRRFRGFFFPYYIVPYYPKKHYFNFLFPLSLFSFLFSL